MELWQLLRLNWFFWKVATQIKYKPKPKATPFGDTLDGFGPIVENSSKFHAVKSDLLNKYLQYKPSQELRYLKEK